MKYIRAHELHECARPVINICAEDEICTGCYCLDSIAKGLNLLRRHQYALFMQTWDHPVPKSMRKIDSHAWGCCARSQNVKTKDTHIVTE